MNPPKEFPARCFKALDIRGSAPEELGPDFAFTLGRACARLGKPARVVIGRDARLSGPMLEDALARGFLAEGAAVSRLGLCGTEEVYHAAACQNFDMGIMVTASHNPANENGFKLVGPGALPISSDSGLDSIKRACASIMEEEAPPEQPACARDECANFRDDYIDLLLELGGMASFRRSRLRMLVNAGNGCAGPVLEKLAPKLPFEIIPMNFEPDGSFPNGPPNPLLPEKRPETGRAVLKHGADLGCAFDGDFDRCFFFDATGAFVEGYYLVGLLARRLLELNPDEKIIHDARVYWNTVRIVKACGGVPVMAKSGHSLMKARMRSENALYGGEMSAHHYFRGFAFCDSGMLAMLLVAGALLKEEKPLAAILGEAMAAFPCSGEINFKKPAPADVIDAINEEYGPLASHQDNLDGLNLEFDKWRFNLRASNTEPLLRLNLESRGDRRLLEEMTGKLVGKINSL